MTQSEKVAEYLRVLGNYEEDNSRARDQVAYHEYYEKAGYAKDALKKMGKDIIDDLLTHLNDPNPKIREQVVICLGTTRENRVLEPLKQQLSHETDPIVKKRIDFWVKAIEAPAITTPTIKKSVIPPRQSTPKSSVTSGDLLGKLSSKISSFFGGSPAKKTSGDHYVRRCFLCNKKIEGGDSMISEGGAMLRSSGQKSQVQGPVFCSRDHYNKFKRNPASFR